MDIEFDPAKDAANITKHGVSLARAAELDVRDIKVDDRKNYGEARYLAFGLLDGLPHCLSFTMRGAVVRAISFRRTHLKEYRRNVAP